LTVPFASSNVNPLAVIAPVVPPVQYGPQDLFGLLVLVISPTSEGEVYLDFVSLFPVNTFKNRKNGMNIKLANMIKDLKPKFFRFPGGCIVEGISLENAFMFKDTIGPVEDRVGRWNVWGYRRTDGIGYHEYLQFCEDINASAMYVLNCGMSCQGRNPEL